MLQRNGPVAFCPPQLLGEVQYEERSFEIDVTRCPRCGTRGMQVIACITQPDVIRDILTHIGESTVPPEIEPPRYSEIECESAA